MFNWCAISINSRNLSAHRGIHTPTKKYTIDCGCDAKHERTGHVMATAPYQQTRLHQAITQRNHQVATMWNACGVGGVF